MIRYYYRNMEIDKALSIIEEKDPVRFPHILGTFKQARLLAKYYSLDDKKCSVAAILHDYAKGENKSRLKEIITKYGDVNIIKYDEEIWHGEAGSILLKLELGITDKDILDAVRYHVTGHPDMNDYAKVVYIADYTEETRKHPGVDFCRYACYISLDVGVLSCSEGIYNYLNTLPKKKIHPYTQLTYEHFLAKVGSERYESIKSHYQGM